MHDTKLIKKFFFKLECSLKWLNFPISATAFDKDTNWKMELVSSKCSKCLTHGSWEKSFHVALCRFHYWWLILITVLFSLDSNEKLWVNLVLSNDLSVLVHVFNLKIDLWHLAFDYRNIGILTFHSLYNWCGCCSSNNCTSQF